MLRTFAFSILVLFVACAPKGGNPPDEPAPATTDPAPPADDGADAGADDGAAAPCKKTGCSGIICAEEDQVSTCEFKPEYACYQQATCERQPDGACGWTKTAELDACLADPPAP